MKVIAQNRRACHDYDIIDTIEAGLLLQGQEVKSCRAGNVHLQGSYVSLLHNTPVLKGASIARYSHAPSDDGYDPHRDRLLLLKRREIERITSLLQEKGVTVVPLEMKAGKYIKLTLGIGRGRKKYDKRQKKKEQDIQRRLQRGGEI